MKSADHYESWALWALSVDRPDPGRVALAQAYATLAQAAATEELRETMEDRA